MDELYASTLKDKVTADAEKSKNILEEAMAVVGPANRGADYGHPLDNFQMEADLMNVWITHRYGRNPMARDGLLHWKDMAVHKLFMKISRELHSHKRDNIVDIAGYAWCYEEAIIEQQRRQEAKNRMTPQRTGLTKQWTMRDNHEYR